MKTALSVIRTHCNYSQALLAEVIGVSRQMVCAWENGSKSLPDNRAAELAALFGVPSAILKENDLQVVQQWCDRPLYPTKKQGRQVFSFELFAHNPDVFLSQPGHPAPAARSRELMLRRSSALQGLSKLAAVRSAQQAEDLNYAEPCVSILERVQALLECALRADEPAREHIALFVLEQLCLLGYVFTGEISDQSELTCWQKQQIQMLRSHWAQVNRTRQSRIDQAAVQMPPESVKEHQHLSERLAELYRYAMIQGISRRDLQSYLKRIIMEEYDDERQN